MRLIIIVFSFLFSSFVSADEFPVTIKTLSNGLTVIVEPMATSQSAAIYALVKTGSVDETDCMGCGLSHYVEHMLFKGTAKRKVGDIAKEVKRLGGVINAQTGFEDTLYTLDLPATHWKEGMDIIADMLTKAVFDEKEAERERTVIHGEMRLYVDRPLRKLSELVFNTAYLQHPYKYPVIGYQKIFDAVKREELFSYYKKHYVPNNIILSVAGHVDPQEVLDLAEKLYQDFQPQPIPVRMNLQEPAIVSPRVYHEEYPSKMFYVSYSFQSIGLLDEDLYALDALAAVLGQGASSLLYQELYLKKHLVEDVQVSDFTPQSKGLFEIQLMLKEDHIKEALKIVDNVIAMVQKTGISPNQLSRIKKQMSVQYYFSNQRPNQIAYRNAQDYAYTGDVRFSLNYVNKVNKISNEDIKRVASRYLLPQRSVTVSILPKSSSNKVVKQQSSYETKDEVIKFDNGLTVILRPDNQVGVFSMNLSMRGGIHEETGMTNGLSNLAMAMWPYSTKRWPDVKLKEYLESNGVSLNIGTSKNSLNIGLSGAQGDDLVAIDVLTELLLNYQFTQKALVDRRNDIFSEFVQREDNITSTVYRNLLKKFFNNHPYGFDQLGTKENLNNFIVSDVTAYINAFVQPSNAVLVLTGNFNVLRVKAVLDKTLKVWKGKPVRIKAPIEPALVTPQSYSLPVDKTQAMIAWAFPAPSMYSKEKYAMEIVDGLLGSGLGGRLFNKIREQFGQAYTLGADFSAGVDTGVFTIHVLTSYEHQAAVKKLVEAEVKNLITQPITSEELDNLKNYLKGQQQMALDTPAALAYTMVQNQLYGLGYDHYKVYASSIDAVSINDVQQVVSKYLTLDHAVAMLTKPKKSIEQNK